MRLALGVLRVSPESFWAMTPIELSAVLGALERKPGSSAPDAVALGALMARFPDTQVR